MPSETIYSRPHNLFSTPDTIPDTNRDAISGRGNVQLLLYPYYSQFDAHELMSVATALVNPRGKGVYATDEAPYAMVDLLNALEKDPAAAKKQYTEEENRERRKKWREFMYNAASNGEWPVLIMRCLLPKDRSLQNTYLELSSTKKRSSISN